MIIIIDQLGYKYYIIIIFPSTYSFSFMWFLGTMRPTPLENFPFLTSTPNASIFFWIT